MAKRIPAVLVLALTACLAWQPAAMAQSSRNKVDIETRFKEAMADPKVADELYKVGRKVLPSQALPGDLIFWGPEGSQSVALFIGNAQMVESTPPAVTVSPVRTTDMTPYLVRMIDQ